MFSYYRMCSLATECVLLLQNVFSYERMSEQAEEIFTALDNGAHIYFCGLKGMMPGIQVHMCVCTHARTHAHAHAHTHAHTHTHTSTSAASRA